MATNEIVQESNSHHLINKNMEISISRAINEISINGDEFILDDNGMVMKFNNKAEAEDFLLLSGIEKEDIDNFTFNEE